MNTKNKLLLPLLILFLTVNLRSQNLIGDEKEIQSILENVTSFSKNVMSENIEQIGNAYTLDAKIFPNNTSIIAGRKAIEDYWTPSGGSRIKYHNINPEEIKINGDEAYDFGYYEGISVSADGNESNWKGKYVIIWRKVEGEWKIYLDIWNSVRD